ncbi:MAG: hypothetical protein WA919_20560 [Coleofasciculaceae cyanobacterium]
MGKDNALTTKLTNQTFAHPTVPGDLGGDIPHYQLSILHYQLSMQSPQFSRRVGRPWAIVRISNDTRPTTVARFVNRQDAEDQLRTLKRCLRTSSAQFTIVFDMSADPNYWEKRYQNNE